MFCDLKILLPLISINLYKLQNTLATWGPMSLEMSSIIMHNKRGLYEKIFRMPYPGDFFSLTEQTQTAEREEAGL